MKIAIYARGTSKASIDKQVEACKKYAEANYLYEEWEELVDTVVPGTRAVPSLNKVMAGDYDVLICEQPRRIAEENLGRVKETVKEFITILS